MIFVDKCENISSMMQDLQSNRFYDIILFKEAENAPRTSKGMKI